MGVLKYKGYIGSVEFSEEDDCLFGKVQGLKKVHIGYEGNTIQELRKDFMAGIDDYLEMCKESGTKPLKPYSGKFVVRMTSDLHSRVAAMAEATGTTINEFVNRAVKNELDHNSVLLYSHF